MSFVLDASMALSWHFKDETTPQADAVFARTVEEKIVVPRHWFVEMANGAMMGERRGRATQEQTAHLQARMALYDIEVDDMLDDPDQAFLRILPLARAHGLTIYDAIYLELAERRGLPIATLDGELAAACRSVGIEALGS